MKRLLALLLIALLLPVAAAAEQNMYVNNPNPNDRLNLRDAPNLEATSIAKFYNHTPVTILNLLPDSFWAEVAVCGTEHGYMDTRYLAISDDVNGLLPRAMVLSSNDHDRLNLREHPSKEARSLGKYGRGARVWVLGFGDDWAFVDTGSQTGWMLREFLSDVDRRVADLRDTFFVSMPDARERLALYSEASVGSMIVGEYWNGTPVDVVGSSDGGMLRVRVGDMNGWMDERYLSAQIDAYELKGVMQSGDQDFYATPNGKVCDHLKACTLATLMGVRSDGWAHVISNGQAGYIRSDTVPGLDGMNWVLDGSAPDASAADGAASDDAGLFGVVLSTPVPQQGVYVCADYGQNGLPLCLPVYADAACTQLAFSLCAGAPVTLLEQVNEQVTRVDGSGFGVQGYTNMARMAVTMTDADAARLRVHSGEVHCTDKASQIGASLREHPDDASHILAMLSDGTSFTVYGISDEWLWVALTESGVEGYLHVRDSMERQQTIATSQPTLLYAEPNEASIALQKLAGGVTLTIPVSTGYSGWMKVLTDDGMLGYVKDDALDYTGKPELYFPAVE